MKIDLNQIIRRHDGEPFVEAPDSDAPLRLETVVLQALTAVTRSDQQAHADRKVKIYKMAQRLSAGGEIELTPEELTFLRERVAEVWAAPIIVGSAFDLLGG